jgi:organic radical activating enzyme
MYCPSELHDSTSRPHDLDTMQSVWKNIYKKTKHLRLPYKISFTGGEVTANKNFLPLVQWLRNTYKDIAVIVITTNGSASADYYLRLAKNIEAISFSTHSEFMDEKIFFDKIYKVNSIMIPPKKSLHVNIMDEYWNQDRIKVYKEWLERHKISYTVNEINYTKQIRTYFVKQGKQNLDQI